MVTQRSVARKSGQKTIGVADAKVKVLDLIAAGAKVADACATVNRSVETYRDWQKHDLKFKAAVADLRSARASAADAGQQPVPDFPEFCEMLGQPLFIHQLRMWDAIEGREPRELLPAFRYDRGSAWEPGPGQNVAGRVIINLPPGFAKALALDTPIFTTLGWSTIGDLRVGDQVFGPDGAPATVTVKSEVFEKQTFEVRFKHGETVVASGDHIWTVVDDHGIESDVSTRDIFKAGVSVKLPRSAPLDTGVDKPFPLDPYLLGCWLGDGHTASGRFTSADAEIVEAFAEFDPRTVSKSDITFATTGLYRLLAELGLIGSKFVPDGYFLGSLAQRTALLQGLMDTDGTCSATGAASFTSKNPDLADGVYTLASGLGLHPTRKEGRATLNGKDCGQKWTVWFTTRNDVQVFRLARKAKNANPVGPRRGSTLRKIAEVFPTETVPTQCISVDNDSHLFLVGRSLTPTHNTTTFSINYTTWLIHKNPNIKIIVVCKDMGLATQILGAVKFRLTSPVHRDLHLRYAPEGGWKDPDQSWTQTAIYVQGKGDGEKDPTMQALGIGGRIYGARSDVIILDDAVTLANVNEFDKQRRWLDQEVESRLDGAGLLALLGTRVAPTDLYLTMRQVEDVDDNLVYTYLSMPAVLDDGDGSPDSWTTLWPEKFPGSRLRKIRRDESTWALVYQQQDVAEDATFNSHAVTASINSERFPGPMTEAGMGHRAGGMSGLYVIGGLDPATVGHTAMQVWGLDRQTHKRYVLDGFNHKNTTPKVMKDTVKRLTEQYGIAEWVIERNAFQRFLTQDEDLLYFLRSRGCKLTEHYTTCVPTDVEILSIDGWKHHADLSVGDLVLTDAGWEPVQEVNVFPAPEKMYRIDTQNLSCDFTEGHRHAVEWRGNSTVENRFVTSDDLRSNTPLRLTVDPVDGPGVGIDFAALVGWYLSEGSQRKFGANIAQSQTKNPTKFAEIRDHLDKMDWQYSLGRTQHCDVFYIFEKYAKTLRDLAPDKVLPVSFVASMTIAERDAFMRAMLLGDGHGESFFNTSEANLVAFESACAMNGYATSRRYHENGNGRFKKNHDCFVIRRKKDKLAHVKLSGRDYVNVVEGSGDVWCPTTPSGSWVARSNGRTFLTGNSNKYDSDFGVQAMAQLFLTAGEPPSNGGGGAWRKTPETALIELPNPRQNAWAAEYINQLVTWQPSGLKQGHKTDLVMASWFCEIAAKRILGHGRTIPTHRDNPFLSKARARGRNVVNLADYKAQLQAEREAA